MTIQVDEKAAEKVMGAVGEQEQARLQLMLPARKATTGTLDVRKDGTYTFTVKMTFLGKTNTQVEEGTWKLVKQDGKKIVLETTEQGKEKAESHKITQVDKDHFYEAAPKEAGPLASAMKMDFRRKK